jgi:hypothetical protein
MQANSSIFDIIDKKIPSSLTSIHSFLFEAQRYLWYLIIQIFINKLFFY